MSDVSGYAFPSAPSPEELAKHPANDLGNALRLVRLVGGVIQDDGSIDTRACELLYLRERGWIAFNGRHWDLRGGEERARRWAHKVASGLIAQGPFSGNPKTWPDFVVRSGNAGASSAMLTQAASYLGADLGDFDRDPMALNVANGVLRFRRDRATKAPKVVFEPRHDPGDRMTRICSVAYDAKAKRPLFDGLLAYAQPEQATRDYLHRAFGYAATGETKEQIFLILQGVGGDGKSTWVNAVREVLGTYATVAAIETFLDTGIKKSAEASPDIARLAGDTRLISTAEPPRGSRLASSAIKSFTGGAPLTARELRRGIFEFMPIGKVILECNNRPGINDSDDGIWRRTRIVLFERQVPRDDMDLDLPDKLRGKYPGVDGEHSGILLWLVEGVLAWMAQGLKSPPAVAEALEDYRRGANDFAEWFNDCIEKDRDSKVLCAELFRSYKDWCEREGIEKPMSITVFGRALGDRQILLAGKDGKGRKQRRGARLRPLYDGDNDAGLSPAAAPSTLLSPGGRLSTGAGGDPFGDDGWVE